MDVDVNSRDAGCFTSLSWAAQGGYEAVAWLLMEREELVVNSKDTYCYAPLACVAKSVYELVVRLLLEREGVDVNAKDVKLKGYTPLPHTARRRREAMV